MDISPLKKFQPDIKQKIFECISQAICEDLNEANTSLELKTHISKPFLCWDLIYRNLMNVFPTENIIYSAKKRGMWTTLLLYDKTNHLLLSFMKEERLQTIKKLKYGKQPQYIRSLISLNSELQASTKQQTMFDLEEPEDKVKLKSILDDICSNFEDDIDDALSRHVLVTFSSKNQHPCSLKAHVLDRDLDVVFVDNWFDSIKPVIGNTIETVKHDDPTSSFVALKPKAVKRLKNKELVSLKQEELINEQ